MHMCGQGSTCERSPMCWMSLLSQTVSCAPLHAVLSDLVSWMVVVKFRIDLCVAGGSSGAKSKDLLSFAHLVARWSARRFGLQRRSCPANERDEDYVRIDECPATSKRQMQGKEEGEEISRGILVTTPFEDLSFCNLRVRALLLISRSDPWRCYHVMKQCCVPLMCVCVNRHSAQSTGSLVVVSSESLSELSVVPRARTTKSRNDPENQSRCELYVSNVFGVRENENRQFPCSSSFVWCIFS